MPSHTTSSNIDFSEYIDQRSRDFAGREWLFSIIGDWLDNPEGPRFFLLSGNPGSGKTAIAARLVQISNGATLPPVGSKRIAPEFLSGSHFCWARDRNWLVSQTICKSLACQLAARYPTFAEKLLNSENRQVHISVRQNAKSVEGRQIGVLIEKISVGDLSPDAVFTSLIREPLVAMAEAGFNEQIVLLVDGLDESLSSSDGVGIVPLLADMQGLKVDVRFIVTSRPEICVERPLRRAGMIELPLSNEKYRQHSRKDMRKYLNEQWPGRHQLMQKLTERRDWNWFCNLAEEKSKDNFQHLSLLLDMLSGIETPITEETVRQFPDELDGIYLEYLERILRRTRGNWSEEFAPVLSVLAIAQGPLSEEQIASFIRARQSIVRSRLKDLGQLLNQTHRDTENPRYALFHASFAEFLLDKKRAEEFWCEEGYQHHRIASFYIDSFVTYWPSCDDYGLRHLVVHVLESTEATSSDVTVVFTPDWIRAKSTRFGERSILTDLRMIIGQVGNQQDLASLFKWSWVYGGFRDRISLAVSAEMLLLYVKLGRTEQALEMISELDLDDTEVLTSQDYVRQHMVYALAEQGLIDQAIDLATSMGKPYMLSETLANLAVRIAPKDPGRAIDIASSQPYSEEFVQLCGLLAKNDEFVDASIELASGRGAALTAITLQLAERDATRALSVAACIPKFPECNGGEEWIRTKDVAMAGIVLALVKEDSNRALEILKRIESQQEFRRALVGVCARIAADDPWAAVALLESSMPDSEGRHKDEFFAWNLALAHITATANNTAIEAVVEKLWTRELNKSFAGYNYFEKHAIDLANRGDLFPLTGNELARRIASHTLAALVSSIMLKSARISSGNGPDFRNSSQAVSQLASMLAIFDVDQALAFVHWASDHLPRRTSEIRSNALLAVVKSVAAFGARAILPVIEQIDGFSHLALIETMRIVSERDFEQALQIIDSIGPQFERTRTSLIGVAGGQVKAGDTERIEQLFKRMPHYIDGGSHGGVLERTVGAVVCAMARYDIDKATALAERHRPRKLEPRTYPFFLDIVVGAATTQHERAKELIEQLEHGICRAKGLLAVAKSTTDEQEKWHLLEEVVKELRNDECDATRLEVVKASLELNPWRALLTSLSIIADQDRNIALQHSVLAVLRKQDASVLPELVEDVHRFTQGNFLLQIGSFIALIEILDSGQRQFVLTWLEQIDAHVAGRVRAYVLAENDLDASLAEYDKLGYRDVAMGEALGRFAVKHPDQALKRFREFLQHDPDATLSPHEVLIDIVGEKAKHDLSAALRIIEEETWEFDLYKSDALAKVAEIVAATDWHQSMLIVVGIQDQLVYSSAICKILEIASPTLPPGERVPFYRAIVAKAESLRGSAAERSMIYEQVLVQIPAIGELPADLLTEITLNLALGDRGTFLRLLPGVTRLIASQADDMPFRLESELEHVVHLLSS